MKKIVVGMKNIKFRGVFRGKTNSVGKIPWLKFRGKNPKFRGKKKPKFRGPARNSAARGKLWALLMSPWLGMKSRRLIIII